MAALRDPALADDTPSSGRPPQYTRMRQWRMTPELDDKIRLAAKINRMSMSDFVRNALADAVERELEGVPSIEQWEQERREFLEWKRRKDAGEL